VGELRSPKKHSKNLYGYHEDFLVDNESVIIKYVSLDVE
jgi:hypothetical protein